MPFPLFRPFLSGCVALFLLLCLPSAASDSGPAAFETLLAESRRLGPNEPQRAVTLAREALALASSQTQPITAELRARTQLAESLRMTSNYPEARLVVDAGLALPTTDSEQLERAQLVHGSGQIFWNTGDFAAAEACFVAAQHTAEILGDSRLLARTLNSRGIIARQQKKFALSAQHFQAALTAAENEPTTTLQIQNNLANLYVDLGELDRARPLYLANLATHTAQDNRRSMANALINLAALEKTAGNLPAALDYNERALTLRRELGVPRHLASAHMSVASSLTALGRTDEALQHLAAAEPIVMKVASHELWRNLYIAYSNTHAAREDFRAALTYQRKAEVENNEVVGEKAAIAIAELQERFETEKRQRELVELRAAQQQYSAEFALQEAELRRSRLQRYTLVGFLALGGITATAMISRQRARARAERLILAQTRAARDAAEDANQLKTKLLDLASHDLKAPLVGMMMTADVLIDESPDRAEIVKPAQAIRAESERMLAFVQDLLDGSAAEANRIPLAPEPVALNPLVATVVASFHPRATRKQQHVNFTATPEPLTLSADPSRLQQVVENLVDNALKFSPAGSTVFVSTRRTDDRVQLLVRDEGPGLGAADQARLFQRFTRLSATPTGGESSSGLGLSLVRDLVQLHGGRIWVESTPGQGATFIAEFPASAA